MAQTMHLVLFGPIFLIEASPWPLHSFILSIIPIKMSYIIIYIKKHILIPFFLVIVPHKSLCISVIPIVLIDMV